MHVGTEIDSRFCNKTFIVNVEQFCITLIYYFAKSNFSENHQGESLSFYLLKYNLNYHEMKHSAYFVFKFLFQKQHKDMADTDQLT